MSYSNDTIMFAVRYMGKTDNAQIPSHLLKYLEETYPAAKVLEALGLPENIDEEWLLSKEYVPQNRKDLCTFHSSSFVFSPNQILKQKMDALLTFIKEHKK